VLSGGRKALYTKSLPSIEKEREISDEELEEIALTFCSSETLNGMIDVNWKTRLTYVQEFSEVFINSFSKILSIFL